MGRRLSRRSFLVGGSTAMVGGLGLATARGTALTARSGELGSAAGVGASRAASLIPVGMAMHVHGSFSEGMGSMSAHLTQAEKLGVDVIWWTDHDWSVNAYGYRSAVRFDGMSERDGPVWWRWEVQRDGAVDGRGEFVTDIRSPDEPGRALRLIGAGTSVDGGTLWYTAGTENFTHRTNLADTILELDVFPEQSGDRGHLVVEITASYHPRTDTRPAGQYVLRYEVGAAEGAARTSDGLVGTVALPAGRGRWQRLTLRPAADIAALWPDLIAGDNALCQLRIGVTVKEAGVAQVVVDRLRILRADRDGSAPLALRDQLVRQYAQRFPGVRQVSALEVSLVRHLNWFGGEIRLPDYGGRPPTVDRSISGALAMVDLIHRGGGLASYNHPLQAEVAEPRALAQLLIATNALGCEIVEIGYAADIAKLLDVFDATARNAVFFTGTGVSDDHEGVDWLGHHANYITNVWARSASTVDLVAALRRGNAWFVNPRLWRGELDLQLDGAPAMGGVVLTKQQRLELSVLATEVPADSSLEVVFGRVDLAGPDRPEPAIERTVVIPPRDLIAGRYSAWVDPGAGSYVRCVVRIADGSVAGVSNPVWLLPQPPPRGVPAARLLEPVG